MRAYFNENDPKAAAWLRELIRAGLIADGDVDERSIVDVRADDLVGYDRVHLFAGVGGWDYALQLAGWPADEPVWTGSCPCQPFSNSGKRQGAADVRHLWPEMFRLIRERRPPVIFGEQVESAVGHGWLDGVFADLETEVYACGAIVLGAHSVSAPHIRQRLWWVADGSGQSAGGLADTAIIELRQIPSAWDECRNGQNHWIPCADGKQRRTESGVRPLAHGVPNRVVKLRGYGNAVVPQVAAEFIRACGSGKGATSC